MECKKHKNMMVLHAFSSGNCIRCNKEVVTEHIPCNKVCDSCSTEYNLCCVCGENILENIKKDILKTFNWIQYCIVDGDTIIIEQEYEMFDEKNSDDCFDVAKENGEMIIDKFPVLKIDEYYCHRNKYSIVNLKIKD